MTTCTQPSSSKHDLACLKMLTSITKQRRTPLLCIEEQKKENGEREIFELGNGSADLPAFNSLLGSLLLLILTRERFQVQNNRHREDRRNKRKGTSSAVAHHRMGSVECHAFQSDLRARRDLIVHLFRRQRHGDRQSMGGVTVQGLSIVFHVNDTIEKDTGGEG